MKRTTKWAVRYLASFAMLTACGNDEISNRTQTASAARDLSDADASAISLKKDGNETVVDSVIVSLSKSQSLGLDGSAPSWQVDMEQRKDVSTNVAAQKYLRVTGTLNGNTSEQAAEIGCLQVELRDNVNFREQGWLRIATNGIAGAKFTEVYAPIFVQQNGWTNLPILNESVTLGMFAKNTVKRFDGTVCFKIDTRDLPSQSYQGQVIVQYLKTSTPIEEPVIELAKFRCSSNPVAINAGEKVTAEFVVPSDIDQINYVVRTNPVMASQGTVSKGSDAKSAIYQSPANPPTSFKAMIEARPDNDNYLPVFCEVQVVAKNDIGVGDDGEIEGITGNVYPLPANTSRLPDFSVLTPVSHLVAANLNIPERSFSAGFPGVKDLVEWFGIRFTGTLKIPAGVSNVKFKVTSDDGANLYLNNQKILDNDGLHAPASKEVATTFGGGEYQVRVDYYQGPRYLIAMQLFWDLGDGRGFQIIPSSAFKRPLQ